MKLNKIFAGALMALLGLPTVAHAQSEPVVINGSLIDWYYKGKDIHSSDIGWFQQPTGGGAYIDDQGVAHAAGEPNIGMLSLTLSSNPGKPLLPEFLIRNTILYSNCGGFYAGGNEYYSFFGHEVNASENIEGEYGSEDYEILVRKWTWDDGYTNVKYQQVGKIFNQPTDLAYDPIDDVVYGVFSIGDGSYKLGTIDMQTMKISFISRESMMMTSELRTLAVNSKGELYGTDKSGNIYQVSKTDGKLTWIGSMGFQSQQRMMSATFDFRTDKMYWLGYTNNGKASAATDGTNNTLSVADGGHDTGLYEITIENGKATPKLIGMTEFKDVELIYDEYGNITDTKTNQYGKMQMTGIYVEGSFTRKNIDQRIVLTSCPTQMQLGETKTVKVNVKNIGLNDVRGRNYAVKLYVNDNLFATIDNNGDVVYTSDMKKSDDQTFTFEITAQQVGEMKIYAEVETKDDEELRNNKTEVATIIVLSKELLPSVTINGIKGRTNITLNWSDPQGHIIDGAEQYAAFSYDGLGAWTMVDADKAYTQKPNNLFSTVSYPNANTPKAFIVMDPMKAGLGTDVNPSGEKFMPHSGNQYFAGLYSALPGDNGSGYEVDNSDFMVSPTLSGSAQTISFWAKGYRGTEATGYQSDAVYKETLEVLYTLDKDNLDPTTYTVAKEEFVINDQQWEKYTAELPAGAKHFALHRTSKATEYVDYEGVQQKVYGTGSFIMMIDDIEFLAEPKTVVNYNVYKNGEKIETLAADATSFNATGASDDDVFYVTAVYAEGESMPSNLYGVTYINAIEAPQTSGLKSQASNIYDLNGRTVKGQLRPGIYVKQVNGRNVKVVIK